LSNYSKCDKFQLKKHVKHKIFKSRLEVGTISDSVKSSEQAHVMISYQNCLFEVTEMHNGWDFFKQDNTCRCGTCRLVKLKLTM